MKYNAKKREVDGIVFDSIGEAERYVFLKTFQDAGIIKDLCADKKKLRFELQCNNHAICIYEADFSYSFEGVQVVEDFKGVETPAFRLKEKLYRAQSGNLPVLIKSYFPSYPVTTVPLYCGNCSLKIGSSCPYKRKKVNKKSKICMRFNPKDEDGR